MTGLRVGDIGLSLLAVGNVGGEGCDTVNRDSVKLFIPKGARIYYNWVLLLQFSLWVMAWLGTKGVMNVTVVTPNPRSDMSLKYTYVYTLTNPKPLSEGPGQISRFPIRTSHLL